MRNERPPPCPVCCHFFLVSFIASHVTVHVALHLPNRLKKKRFDEERRNSISWIVVSRSFDKYVTELAVDHMKAMHYDEASPSTGLRCNETQDRTGLKRFVIRH